MPYAPKPSPTEFHEALARLGVYLEASPSVTLSGWGCRATFDEQPAYVKVTNEPEELAGARALEQWHGEGAVRVLARSGNAIVLERAGSTLRSTVADDPAATRVLCAVARRLHAHEPTELGQFPSLRAWFSALFANSQPEFDPARAIAEQLLGRDTPVVLLHGDLHHENVLDGANRGWLAIDPKGIVGPREFDYCNIFTNWTREQAIHNFDARLQIVAHAAHIPHTDLLRWIVAWSALSGIWHREDGDEALAAFPHTISALALDRLRARETSGAG